MPTYQEHALRRQDVGGMNESISKISILLQEVAGHIAGGKAADARFAFDKLQRISSLATTLAFTVKLSH